MEPLEELDGLGVALVDTLGEVVGFSPAATVTVRVKVISTALPSGDTYPELELELEGLIASGTSS